MLAASGARYFTEVDWRVGERPEVVRDLAASGCVQVLVGFESLVREHTGMGGKKAGYDRMLDACLAIQAAGVAVIGCFIVGSDGETAESMADLGGRLAESPLADVQVTMLTAFPGTPLRERLKREGRLIPDRGWSSCTLFDATFVPDRMTVRELERGFRNVVAMAHGQGPAASSGSSVSSAGWRKASAAASFTCSLVASKCPINPSGELHNGGWPAVSLAGQKARAFWLTAIIALTGGLIVSVSSMAKAIMPPDGNLILVGT